MWKIFYCQNITTLPHIKTQHTREHEDIKCDKCNQTFHSFEDYAKHTRTHRSRSFQLEQKCNICGNVIKGKSNLTRPIQNVHEQEPRLNVDMVHVDVYPFKCKQCKAIFKRSDNLKRHYKTHSFSWSVVKNMFCSMQLSVITLRGKPQVQLFDISAQNPGTVHWTSKRNKT